MAIPWYYMWSDNYRIFHEIMKDSIKEREFEVCPIEIPQATFDSELYTKEGSHFLSGSFIKLNSILDCLKKAKEESQPYILFTDIDIVVRKNIYSDVKKFMDESIDMVFMKERDEVNTGFMLLRICDEVINFFIKVINNLKYINTSFMDQQCVNVELPSYTGKYACFNEELYTPSNTWNGSQSCKVIQVLCDGQIKEYNIVEKIVSIAQLINIKPYMKYIDPILLPYMDKFIKEVLCATPEIMFKPIYKNG